MRRTVFGKIGVVGLFLVGCSSLFADVITLGVSPSGQTVGLGSPVNVSLRISGLGNQVAPSLGTFDLNLGFDPTILSFSSAVFGDPILGDQLDSTGLGNTITFINPGFETVELFGLSLDSAGQLNSLQAADFILGSLVFDTIGIGTSSLNLSINALGDADGSALSASVQDGSADITAVSTVPEPSSAVLFATAALAIAICRRSLLRRLSK